jgi:hypothetical protein
MNDLILIEIPESHCSPTSKIPFPHFVQLIEGGMVETYCCILLQLQLERHPTPLSHSSSASQIEFPHPSQSIENGVVGRYPICELQRQLERHPTPLSHSSRGGS